MWASYARFTDEVLRLHSGAWKRLDLNLVQRWVWGWGLPVLPAHPWQVAAEPQAVLSSLVARVPYQWQWAGRVEQVAGKTFLQEQTVGRHHSCCGWFRESWLSPSTATHILSDLGKSLPFFGKWSPSSGCLGAGAADSSPPRFSPMGSLITPNLAFPPVR